MTNKPRKLSRAKRVIAFIEKYCIVPEADLIGQPLVLDAFQRKFIIDIYDNPHGTQRAFLSIARKNAKTALIACILLAHIAGPEAVQNSRIISGAMSKDQAAEVYNYASKMVMMSAELSARVRIVPSGKRLFGLVRNVEYQAISADATTAHGKSPILAILDEIGQVRGPNSPFVDAIVTSQLAYSNAMLFAMSTQAPNDADLFSVWIDDAKLSKDPRIVSHIYEAKKDCDVLDRKEWKAANPALGKFVSLKKFVEAADRAKRMPSFENTFRNLHLNQRVEMSSPLIARSIWLLNSMDPDDAVFYEEPVYVGLDLSAKTDLTAMIMIAFRERWHVKCVFWTPEKGLKERSKRDRAQYDVWAQQGLIRTIPGAAIDLETVGRDLAETLDGMNVVAIAYDRWRFDILKKELIEIGFDLGVEGEDDYKLKPFGQGFKDMAPAIDSLEELLLNEQIAHGANPVLTMCVANAKAVMDPAGNRKLDKAKATGRIDGAVALTMAVGVAVAQAQQEKSFWERSE